MCPGSGSGCAGPDTCQSQLIVVDPVRWIAARGGADGVDAGLMSKGGPVGEERDTPAIHLTLLEAVMDALGRLSSAGDPTGESRRC